MALAAGDQFDLLFLYPKQAKRYVFSPFMPNSQWEGFELTINEEISCAFFPLNVELYLQYVNIYLDN
jgi:hypothetical protein